ncbi:MAG TPA: AsmA-like C-terminal domain-containing protein [Acidocella sp.]|jgi:hypothetical protein|nr:AsmA-like C-terminal domain-containing protein [Acidocella sp.]
MKLRAGQAGKIILEAMHQLGRIALLLFMLVLAALGLFAFSLSRHPIQIPNLTSWLATQASGESFTVRMGTAELAWAGYHEGASVPLVLRLSDVAVRSAAGALLAEVPQADLVVPPQDLLGGRGAILLLASAARITGSEAPVSIRANIWPARGFTLARATFYVSIGKGRVDAGSSFVPLDSASFTISVTPGAVDVTDGMLALTPIGGSAPRGSFSFVARRHDDWTGTLHASIDAVRADEIGQYWPPVALSNTRKWVLNHITSGTARNAGYVFSLTAPDNLSSLDLTNAVGGFDGVGLTLFWLQGGVPLTGLNGHFAMPDIDNAVITASAGQVGKVQLRQGRMDIVGLNQRDQTGQLELDLAGQVPDVLAVLDAPPLGLLANAPRELSSATGQAEGHVSATIPFEQGLSFKDITLKVTAQIHNVFMPAVLPPLGLQHGEVQLQTDGRQLALQAKAQFTGAPMQLKLKESFAGAGKQDLTVSGTAGEAFWHFIGIDTASALYGPAAGAAPFTLHVTGAVIGAQTAQLQADLSKMGFTLPALGWSKMPGQAGHLAFTVSLQNGTFVAAQNFTAAAPGLNVTGTQQGNSLSFATVAIGRTRAAGRLSWPAKPGGAWVADFSGTALDLRQPKTSHSAPAQSPPTPAKTPPAAAPSGPPWQVHLAFDRLYLADSPAPPLAAFSLTAAGRGASLLQAEGATNEIYLSVAPQSPSLRTFALHSNNAGLLLRALGGYQHMQGGRLALRAEYGEGQPAQGKATLEEARFINAPDVTKFLQALTLYGLADVASGPGLRISRAEIPFILQNDVLTLHGARAYSSSLGFTASGNVNLATSMMDLDATIVPAYAVNSLPGKIPLIGRLFSAEKGGGLLAMRAHISGPIDNARVSVNPLSALTPGFLRSIFGIGGQRKAPQPASH